MSKPGPMHPYHFTEAEFNALRVIVAAAKALAGDDPEIRLAEDALAREAARRIEDNEREDGR